MTPQQRYRRSEKGRAYHRAWKKAHPLTEEQRAKAAARRRAYYERNKAKVDEASRRRKLAAVKVRYEMLYRLKSKPCMDCGGTFPPYVMDFDHRPGEVKLFSMTGMAHRNLRAAEAEIAKCDVVCANCHRIRTKRRIDEAKQGVSESR